MASAVWEAQAGAERPAFDFGGMNRPVVEYSGYTFVTSR